MFIKNCKYEVQDRTKVNQKFYKYLELKERVKNSLFNFILGFLTTRISYTQDRQISRLFDLHTKL